VQSSFLWYILRASLEWPCQMLCTVICTLTTNCVRIEFLSFAKFEVLTAAPKRMCALWVVLEVSMGRCAPIFMDHDLSKLRKRLNQRCSVTSQRTGVRTTRYFYSQFFWVLAKSILSRTELCLIQGCTNSGHAVGDASYLCVPSNGTSFMSTFWILEFWGGS